MINITIKPGQTWLDTEGNPIQAHGGKIFYENDTFYWYGEDKEKTDGKNGIWTWGVRCYSSQDLYNWKNEGLIIEPITDDEESMLHPNKRLDRPHILYNDQSRKYICWIKYSGDDACFAIMSADHLLGPYVFEKEVFRPFGKKAGDFDLIKDESTGKAYLYFDSEHAGIYSVELTADYLDVTENYVSHFEGLHPPFVREAPAHLLKDGTHYLLTSGLTGYIPNPSEAAQGESFHGPFTVMGDLHPEDTSCSSYNSQISGVFKHPTRDLYIALADRWVPEYVVTKERYDILSRCIASRFDQSYSATEEERKQLMDSPMLQTANTSIAKYVWQPIEWEDGRPVIKWYDEWRIEDYS